MDCSTPGFPVLHHLPELAQTHVYGASDAIQPSLPLSSPSPPDFNLSQHQSLFQWVSSSNQVAKALELSVSISPSNEDSALISFMIDWFDLLAVQGTLKSLLQHHSWKTSVLWHSVFFMVQLWHPYMTPGKTTAFTRQTFVSKVMSLFFNMLSTFVTSFLPRSKHLLISWLQSPSALIYEPKVCHCSRCFSISLPWRDGAGRRDCRQSSSLDLDRHLPRGAPAPLPSCGSLQCSPLLPSVPWTSPLRQCLPDTSYVHSSLNSGV